MNAIEIKERRLFLQLTQKELAKRIGVSTQTINGYENGKEIPSTKYQILESVLKNNESNIIKEPQTEYQKSIGSNTFKIEEAIEKYDELNRTVELAKELGDFDSVNHHKYLLKLLNTQIKMFQKSNRQTSKDEKIINNLNNESEN